MMNEEKRRKIGENKREEEKYSFSLTDISSPPSKCLIFSTKYEHAIKRN